MTEYQKLEQQYTLELENLTRQYNQISLLRLATGLLFFTAIYFLFKTGNYYWAGLLILVLVIFIYLINLHQRIAARKQLSETLKNINQDEIAFLGGERKFEDGKEYYDPHHLYSYDLDIFGPNSLFQYLNRTATWKGSQLLAGSLLNRMPKEAILENQKAIAELDPLLDLRQKIQALGLINRDNRDLYQFLLQWAEKPGRLGKITMVAIFLLPVLLGICLLLFLFKPEGEWLNYIGTLFLLNLITLGNSFRKIREEISGLDRLNRVIKHYGLILREIEESTFKADRLKAIRHATVADGSAALHLKKLAYLLNQLESVFNGMAVLLFSGTVAHHLHLLRKVYHWKEQHAVKIPGWLEAIAEYEMLSSMANFKHNNPEFAFPVISEQSEMIFRNLAHPLVRQEVRVGNDISFNDHRFVILTGSNMSGKSTFLRSIGVNTVLACTGAPVCASEATLYPFKVLVSMRVADSLAENESYFYAEVKRLKQITEEMQTGHCLVLLDEILRGTNSDDKRNGTLEVIRRMVREQAYGMIATHDLEICRETANHPDILVNKCFEVEIRNDELFFDYILRDGVCVNQSATFLMKKTGII